MDKAGFVLVLLKRIELVLPMQKILIIKIPNEIGNFQAI
jgi:hypothetical protein